MHFWLRHSLILLVTVVLPFSAALYADIDSELERAQRMGAAAAKTGVQSLRAQLTLEAHHTVGLAMSLSQHVSDRDLVRRLDTHSTTKRDVIHAQLQAVLEKSLPDGGFAFVAGEDGVVVAEAGRFDTKDRPENVTGIPLFRETQFGYSLDGVWKEGTKLTLVGGAPLVYQGRAAGAVIVAKPIDVKMVRHLSNSLDADLTVVAGGKVVGSTLETELAREIASLASPTPTQGGRLTTPLQHDFLPLLPVFIDRNAEGLAYTSMLSAAPGSADFNWVVSVPSAESLRGVASRQEIILAGMAAVLMLAFLVGLINHRIYVRPIAHLSEHLSEIQLGRGERELPEATVSEPFRRLVRLVNMTVQKIPARLSTLNSASELNGLAVGSQPISSRSLAAGGASSRMGSSTLDVLNTSTLGSLDNLSSVDLSSGGAAPVPAASGSQPIDVGDASHSFGRTLPRTQPISPSSTGDAAQNLLAEALKSMGAEPTPLGVPKDETPGSKSDPSAALFSGQADDAIADAIHSLEASSSGAAAPMPAQKKRSASEIRGGNPMSASEIRGAPAQGLQEASQGDDSPFPPSQSEMLRLGALLPSSQDIPGAGTPDASAPRGGGSLNLGFAAPSSPEPQAGLRQKTVVAPVSPDLLAESAKAEAAYHDASLSDSTIVTSVPPSLQSSPKANGDASGIDAEDELHFKEVFKQFVSLREQCGENTGTLVYERFVVKLMKNRESLMKKYNCRTVRFQVYEKGGKAALKATPVRA